jgi:hypothetical protein
MKKISFSLRPTSAKRSTDDLEKTFSAMDEDLGKSGAAVFCAPPCRPILPCRAPEQVAD